MEDGHDGVIESFDGADGLGWIALDGGRRVRFGLTALEGVRPEPGQRVRVGELREVLGNLRASRVEPIFDTWDVEELVWPESLQAFSVVDRWVQGERVQLRLKQTPFDREAVRAAEPRWPGPEAFADLALTPAEPGLWSEVTPPAPHPFFEPWHASIVAAGLGCTLLVDEELDGPVTARVGGDTAMLAGAWPECPNGHGPMTLLVSVAPQAFAGLIEEPRRLTIHACVRCFGHRHTVRLARKGAVASVSWRRDADCRDQTATAEPTMSTFELRSKRGLSIPRSGLSQPRLDVKGFEPVRGVPETLFAVKLQRDGVTDPARAYDDAGFAFDAHYAPNLGGIVLGGYPVFRFDLCPACGKPRRQLLYLSDYFTDDEFGDLLEGSNELTLLSCSRTPKCGGPEKGLLVLDP